MRQRSVKNRDIIVDGCKAFLAEFPKENKGKWNTVFPENPNAPLFLEIGSGKGAFISGMAEKYPNFNFLACEGGYNIYLRVLQKAKEKNQSNLRLIAEYIINSEEYFSPGELSGIYLNFCDPWPKDRYEKRRLTHRIHLSEYSNVVKPGGFLCFKTDNDVLFDFSLAEIDAAGLEILELSRDLHHSPFAKDNVLTEYESKFSENGKNINYVKLLFNNI